MYFIKYHLVGNSRQTLFMASLLIAIFLIGCHFAAISESNSNPISNNTETLQTKCKNVKVEKKPDGKELEINIEMINDNEFLIKIKNLSNYKVFLPYSLGENNLSSAVSFVTKKRDQSGKFTTCFAGGDVAPKLRPIEPTQEIGFQFFEIEKGDYRLRFNYLVDENLTRLLTNPDCLFKFPDLETKLNAEANAQITSPLLK